jgi:hypothetical protein
MGKKHFRQFKAKRSHSQSGVDETITAPHRAKAMKLTLTTDSRDSASGTAAAADPSPVFTSPDKAASLVAKAGQEQVTLSSFGVGLSDTCKGNKSEQVLPTENLSCEQPKPVDQFMFAIISKGRSANVPAIEKLFENTGTSPVWVVGEGEKADYVSNGATTVHEGGKLCGRL